MATAKGDVWFVRNLAGSGTPQPFNYTADETLERGDLVTISTTTAGQVEKVDDNDSSVFGLVLEAGDSSDEVLVLPLWPWLEFGATQNTLSDVGDQVGINVDTNVIYLDENTAGTSSDEMHAVVVEILDSSAKEVGVVFPYALAGSSIATVDNS